jgi:DNA-directed RNA polymerase sigma subunit (sigma70/sigma32)
MHNPVTKLIGEEKAHVIQDALSTLDSRTQKVISWRFGLSDAKDAKPRDLKWIGRKCRIGPERIRQIEVIGLKKLKKVLESKDFHNVKEVEA